MPRLTVKALSEQLADQEIQLTALTLVANQLTQIAKQQDEAIAALTGKLEELAESHNRLQERELQTFTLSSSTARRAELHGNWIAELFNRLNDHVNDHVNE